MSSIESERRNFIVDASIGVKWLVEESHSAEARMLMAPDVRLHVPSLFFMEVAQTLWKKAHQRHEITVEDGREIFELLLVLPLVRHPVDLLFESSFEIALQTGRTVYDSVYLALARMNDWKFVTADERLFNALHGGPFERLLLWVGDIPSLFPEAVSIVDQEWDNFEIASHVVEKSIEEIELSVGYYTRERLTDDHLSRAIGSNEEFLDLANSRVTDAGLAYLRDYPRLRNVILKDTIITDRGLIHLQALANLRSLDLIGTQVTREGLLELRRSLPNLTIIHEEDDTAPFPQN